MLHDSFYGLYVKHITVILLDFCKFLVQHSAVMFYCCCVFTFTQLSQLGTTWGRHTYRRSCKEKVKSTWLVCFQSAIKQTQIVNVPLKPHVQISRTGNQALAENYFFEMEYFTKIHLNRGMFTD